MVPFPLVLSRGYRFIVFLQCCVQSYSCGVGTAQPRISFAPRSTPLWTWLLRPSPPPELSVQALTSRGSRVSSVIVNCKFPGSVMRFSPLGSVPPTLMPSPAFSPIALLRGRGQAAGDGSAGAAPLLGGEAHAGAVGVGDPPVRQRERVASQPSSAPFSDPVSQRSFRSEAALDMGNVDSSPGSVPRLFGSRVPPFGEGRRTPPAELLSPLSKLLLEDPVLPQLTPSPVPVIPKPLVGTPRSKSMGAGPGRRKGMEETPPGIIHLADKFTPIAARPDVKPTILNMHRKETRDYYRWLEYTSRQIDSIYPARSEGGVAVGGPFSREPSVRTQGARNRGGHDRKGGNSRDRGSHDDGNAPSASDDQPSEDRRFAELVPDRRPSSARPGAKPRDRYTRPQKQRSRGTSPASFKGGREDDSEGDGGARREGPDQRPGKRKNGRGKDRGRGSVEEPMGESYTSHQDPSDRQESRASSSSSSSYTSTTPTAQKRRDSDAKGSPSARGQGRFPGTDRGAPDRRRRPAGPSGGLDPLETPNLAYEEPSLSVSSAAVGNRVPTFASPRRRPGVGPLAEEAEPSSHRESFVDPDVLFSITAEPAPHADYRTLQSPGRLRSISSPLSSSSRESRPSSNGHRDRFAQPEASVPTLAPRFVKEPPAPRYRFAPRDVAVGPLSPIHSGVGAGEGAGESGGKGEDRAGKPVGGSPSPSVPSEEDRVVDALRRLIEPLAGQLARLQKNPALADASDRFRPVRAVQAAREPPAEDSSYVLEDMVLEPENVVTIALMLRKELEDSGSVDSSVLDEVSTIVMNCAPKPRSPPPIEEPMRIPLQYAVLRGNGDESGISGSSFIDSLKNGVAGASADARVVILRLAGDGYSGASASRLSDTPTVTQAFPVSSPARPPARPPPSPPSAVPPLNIEDAREYIYQDESLDSASTSRQTPREKGAAVQTSALSKPASDPGDVVPPDQLSTGTPDLAPELTSLASLRSLGVAEPPEESERAKLWRQFQRDLQYYPFYVTTYQRCGRCHAERKPLVDASEEANEVKEAEVRDETTSVTGLAPEQAPVESKAVQKPEERETPPDPDDHVEEEPVAVLSVAAAPPRLPHASAGSDSPGRFTDQVAISDLSRGRPRRPAMQEVSAVPDGVEVRSVAPRAPQTTLTRRPPRPPAREASPELVRLVLPKSAREADVVTWIARDGPPAPRAKPRDPAKVLVAAKRDPADETQVMEIFGGIRREDSREKTRLPSPQADSGERGEHMTEGTQHDASPSPQIGVIDLANTERKETAVGPSHSPTPQRSRHSSPASSQSSHRSTHSSQSCRSPDTSRASDKPSEQSGQSVQSRFSQLSWETIKPVAEPPVPLLAPDREAEELALKIMRSSNPHPFAEIQTAGPMDVEALTLKAAMDATVDEAVKAVMDSIKPAAGGAAGKASEGQKDPRDGPLAASGVINPRGAPEVIPVLVSRSGEDSGDDKEGGNATKNDEYSYSYSYSYSDEEGDGSKGGSKAENGGKEPQDTGTQVLQSTPKPGDVKGALGDGRGKKLPSQRGEGEEEGRASTRSRGRRALPDSEGGQKSSSGPNQNPPAKKQNSALDGTPQQPARDPRQSASSYSSYSSYSSERSSEQDLTTLSSLERRIWGPPRAPKIHLQHPDGGPSLVISDPEADALLSISALLNQGKASDKRPRRARRSTRPEHGRRYRGSRHPARAGTAASQSQDVSHSMTPSALMDSESNPAAKNAARVPPAPCMPPTQETGGPHRSGNADGRQSAPSAYNIDKAIIAPLAAPYGVLPDIHREPQNPSVLTASSLSEGQVYTQGGRQQLHRPAPAVAGKTGDFQVDRNPWPPMQPWSPAAAPRMAYAGKQDASLNLQAPAPGQAGREIIAAGQGPGSHGLPAQKAYTSGISTSLLATSGAPGISGNGTARQDSLPGFEGLVSGVPALGDFDSGIAGDLAEFTGPAGAGVASSMGFDEGRLN